MTRSILITGASSGIGKSTAEYLAAKGWRVYGTSRREQISDSKSGVQYISLDVCDDASVRSGVKGVLEETGGLDAVVCNAGMGIYGSVEEVSIEDARGQFETNFFGALRVLSATLPSMRTRGEGRVLLVGSLAGRAPIPFQAHYSASKAAVDALSSALRLEVAPFGVHVSLIEPGDVNTPFNTAMNWETSPSDSPYRENLERCEEVIRKSLPEAPPPGDVARMIERALEARRPRVRYTVGDSAWLVPIARRLLPDRISLELIRRHFGI